MSTLEVEILLHYSYSPIDYPNLDAPAMITTINKFIKLGLLREKDWSENGSKYEGNSEALSVYVAHVCNVPLPKQKWIIENDTL